jgi:L-asparagine oxygenase
VKAHHVFTENQHEELCAALFNLSAISPYCDYPRFQTQMIDDVKKGAMPQFFLDLCQSIRADRIEGRHIHVLKNCPVDVSIPDLNHDDPVNDKYRLKTTFLGEAFLGAFAYLLESPLLSYATRNNGDFFTDVVSINRFLGMRTGFTDGDLVYHNDRSSHPVRADYIALLGVRCPSEDLVYTTYVDSQDIIDLLTPSEIEILSKKWYFTEVDDLTKDKSPDWNVSAAHAVLQGEGKICFTDTMTHPLFDAPIEAVRALLAFTHALTKAAKHRHKLDTGDLLVFSNQYGLHNRERIEVNNPKDTAKRWLLKTYSFKNQAVADTYAPYWVNGIYGCVGDSK